MTIRPPAGYLTVPNARDVLERWMYGKNSAVTRDDGTVVRDAKQAASAAKTLRQAILSGDLELFALLSSHKEPTRIYQQPLIEAALFPDNDTVLTFCHVNRRRGAPFGLSRRDFEELMRDPLCVEQSAFRGWLKSQERKKAWPRHQLNDNTHAARGRPPRLRDQAIEVIEELQAKGRVTPSMSNKEVHILVAKARPSLKGISPDTLRRARKDVSSKPF